MQAIIKKSTIGHAAHSRQATEHPLPGKFCRPVKVAFLGAGSWFTPKLINDILRTPGNNGGILALVDVDSARLKLMEKVIKKLIAQLGVRGWKVQADTDRKTLLPGCDYLVNCIEVNGAQCVRYDYEIPLKYGVEQCIGDTIGPGGLFKALRTIPVFVEILRDAERFCPQALVLNYTNPMNMLCLAAGRTSCLKVVGLCHSVQGTSMLLADYCQVPYKELEWECAGINHLAWFTKLEHKGENLYPSVQKKFSKEIRDALKEFDEGRVRLDSSDGIEEKTGRLPYSGVDLIRKDMCLHFGAFITESSGHLSEYLPYYRNNPQGRKLLRHAYHGGPGYYASNWPRWRQISDKERADTLAGKKSMDWPRSWEYASWIIEAREKNAPFRIHGNVMNSTRRVGRLITNLPADGCVEVACVVDRNGVQPIRYGALPPQMAGVCASNMAMFDLGASAAIHRSIESAIHALLLDPYTSAVCTPAQIKAMTLELFKAQKDFLVGFK